MKTWIVGLFVVATLAGCTEAEPEPQTLLWNETEYGFDAATQDPAMIQPTGCELEAPEPATPIAVIETNLGTIRAELWLEMVPITVQNFIDLAEAGTYDGSPFHRILTGFMMQGGDYELGNGRGGQAAGGGDIPDEFHRLARHDSAGLLSMANAGPNTGGSQFFVTFRATPQLDDRHSVFGQVIDGWDVLEAIEDRAGTREEAPPRIDVTLETLTIEYPDPVFIEQTGLSLWSPDPDHPARKGGTTQFIVVVENESPKRMPICLSVTAGDGVVAAIEPGQDGILPAYQRQAFIVDVRNEGGGGVVHVAAHGPGVGATLGLVVEEADLGPAVVEGKEVRGHYIGMTVDGRVFDTSVEAVADYARDEELGYITFQHRGAYQPFSFTPGGGVIQGFTDIAVRMEEGGIGAGRVAPEQAYGHSGQSPLGGRTLIFQLEVLEFA